MELNSRQIPSPDGCYSIDITSVPMLMSHEVDVFSLLDAKNGKNLFHAGNLWDASNVEWAPDSRKVTIFTRQYPGNGGNMELHIDLETMTGQLVRNENVVLSGPLEELAEQMKLYPRRIA